MAQQIVNTSTRIPSESSRRRMTTFIQGLFFVAGFATFIVGLFGLIGTVLGEPICNKRPGAGNWWDCLNRVWSVHVTYREHTYPV